MEPKSDNNKRIDGQEETYTLSIHHQKDRGTRIYIRNKDLKKIREKFGEDFFLFNDKKIVAQIDPGNDTIMISPADATSSMTNHTLINSNLDFFESLDEPFADLERETFGQNGLDFYMPIKGTGDPYWIAEVLVGDQLAFYCISDSQSNLNEEIQRKTQKHFPGLLASSQVNIHYFSDNLVYSPVPSTTAQNAYKNLAHKTIKNIEIDPEVSIPNDADLTPLVDIGEGTIKGLQIKKRGLLAKYEILAIAEDIGKVVDIKIVEIDGELVWQVSTENGELWFDIVQGNRRNPN